MQINDALIEFLQYLIWNGFPTVRDSEAKAIAQETRMVLRTRWGLEYSIHECPSKFSRELKGVFPKADSSEARIIPTCQQANVDLTNWGDEIEEEKDRLLERFSSWAEGICRKLISAGYWADYVDPCSGLPMIDKSRNQTYNEVEGFSVLLGYKPFDAGGCKVISHPEWGVHVYPATMFTNAPKSLILSVICQSDSFSA